MNKHFVFHDASWYDSPACDCCDGSWVDTYNCISHPELYWSMGSWTECYQEAIYLVLGLTVQDYEFLETTPYYNMNSKQLWKECQKLGITVEFEE